MLLMGFLRENFVVLRDILYGFAPLHLMALLIPLPVLAIGYAFGLQAVKSALGL